MIFKEETAYKIGEADLQDYVEYLHADPEKPGNKWP